MRENINDVMFNDFTNMWNDKLNKRKDFCDYLKDRDKEDLIWLRGLYAHATNDNNFFEHESQDMFDWTKEEIVEDILNFLDNKMVLILQYFYPQLMKDLITISSFKKDFLSFNIEKDNPISIVTIFTAHVLGVIFVKKNKNGNILIHMPAYIKQKIMNLADCAFFEYYCEVFEYTKGVVDTYGAIQIDEIYDIIKDYILISPDRYFNMLMFATSTKVNLFEYDICDDIIYNMCLTQEQAKELVNANKLKTIYSKEMYQSIASKEYFEQLEPYKHLLGYLMNNYDIDLTDEGNVFMINSIIEDYIKDAQSNLEKAKKKLVLIINNMFESDDYAKANIVLFFEGIRKKMPSWKHGGKIANISTEKKVGRNKLCPCGSGKKYKECHGKNMK